jgi:predicted nucleotidyltransferase
MMGSMLSPALPPRRSEVLAVLAAHREELRRLRVKSISLFGSVARDEARTGSDIDLLVELERPAGFFALAEVQEYLEQRLGRSVDLVTPGGLKPQLRRQVVDEAIEVA